jgi:CO/xanthine dehydrogenase Mo-binding subunit
MDPVEFRLKNLVGEGEECAFGEAWENVRAAETLNAAIDAAGYRNSRPPNVGLGVAIGERGTGGGEGTADITLNLDGSVVVGTPIFDQGTGQHTTIVQVVSEELGILRDQIEIRVWDTDVVPSDAGLAGSHGTLINTTAAYEAAQEIKSALVRLAAEQLEWPEGQTYFERGEIRRRDANESAGWTELLRRAGQSVTARGHVNPGRSHTTSFVATVAEVAVDPETGETDLLRFTTAHDSGVVVNPVGHQGQISGGFVSGLGYALMEEVRVEDGRVTTLHFGDYKMPTARDLPPLETVLLPSEEGSGPYNIRGIGEHPCIAVAPAIANAVEDACGVRIRDLPVTAEKVFAGLEGVGSGNHLA